MRQEEKVKRAVEKENEFISKAVRMDMQRRERGEEEEKIEKRQRYSAPEPEDRGEKRNKDEAEELFESDLEGDEEMQEEIEKPESTEGAKRRRRARDIGQVRIISEIRKATPSPHVEGEGTADECEFEGAWENLEEQHPQLVYEAKLLKRIVGSLGQCVLACRRKCAEGT